MYYACNLNYFFFKYRHKTFLSTIPLPTYSIAFYEQLINCDHMGQANSYQPKMFSKVECVVNLVMFVRTRLEKLSICVLFI